MLTQITNHSAIALSRLMEQYKNKPNLAGLITAYVDQMQKLEDATAAMLVARTIDAAAGVQLDEIGEIVGLQRGAGEADAPYRLRIRARVIQNISQGEPELIIQVFKILTSSSFVFFGEGHPASVVLGGDGSFGNQTNINALYLQIQLALPAGVRLDEMVSFPAGDAFSMADANDGKGLGDDLDATAGGQIGEFLFNNNDEFAIDGTDPKGAGLGDDKDPLVGGVLL